jgi:ATP-dependent helicase/nuclease subunit B
VDADFTAAWKGSAVHKVLEEWLKQDDCDPDKLRPRALSLLSSTGIHPMLRALWQPRLMEAIDWIAGLEQANQEAGRQPLAAEVEGETDLAGVTVKGKVDRIDRFADGALAVVDYKTGKAPAQKAVDAGFALQLGLLGLIAEAGGFPGVEGTPQAHEYWSMSKQSGGSFGKVSRPDKDIGAAEFLAHAERAFRIAAEKWLTGDAEFTAKLHPAYAPYGDYDQLMRLEEWYGRQ